MTRYRFQFLLSALIILILTLPLLPALPLLGNWSRYAASFFFSLMLLAAVAAVSQRRAVGMIALCVYAVTAMLEIFGIFYQSVPLQIADHALSIIFLGGVIIIILKNLFYTGKISIDTICAALSVYLLMAILWSVLYTLVDAISPGSFAFNTEIGNGLSSMQFDDKLSMVPLYYSLVTITTLGYGDIVPITPMASMLAVIEAVIGQFYLTVLVAWLVGMHISSSLRLKAND